MMLMTLNREVKRVPLDFDWDLHKVWKGYLNPHYKECQHCKSGYTKGRMKLQRILTELLDYKDNDLNELSKNLSGSDPSFIGYDGVARWHVEKRIIKLANLDPDIWGICKHCDGSGIDPSVKEKYDNWKLYEPPIGEGYQCWETTSEGSPISPVFKTFDKLCEWLSKNPSGISKKLSKDDWKKALKDSCPAIDMFTNELINYHRLKPVV